MATTLKHIRETSYIDRRTVHLVGVAELQCNHHFLDSLVDDRSVRTVGHRHAQLACSTIRALVEDIHNNSITNKMHASETVLCINIIYISFYCLSEDGRMSGRNM